MAIKVDIARPTRETEESIKKGYLYKDIKFDLNMAFTQGKELFREADKKDFEAIFDVECIINSIKNILTTTPGQKLLNPLFGLDLRNYLFEPVSDARAFFIGQDILSGLVFQEPRISVDNIEIVPIPEEMQYIINLTISIPDLKRYRITLKGVLDNEGYNFI
jgi:uncharacterized protein